MDFFWSLTTQPIQIRTTPLRLLRLKEKLQAFNYMKERQIESRKIKNFLF